MASLAGVRLVMRNTGTFRNLISRPCLRGAVTQLQLNERFFHCNRQSTIKVLPQVNIALSDSFHKTPFDGLYVLLNISDYVTEIIDVPTKYRAIDHFKHVAIIQLVPSV